MASLWLVFTYIYGVKLEAFANRLFHVLAHVLGCAGCDDWSQIHPRSGVSTETLLAPSYTPWQRNRVLKEKLGFCPIFSFANCPPFSAENRFAKRSQNIRTESTKFALDTFPSLWSRGWHPFI